MSRDPDWLLIRRIIRIVTERGGLHRAELAEALHLPAYGESMQTALAIAWKQRKIDFCGQYVVRPGTFRKPATTTGGQQP
jgi:hypothetical protein